MQMSQWTIVVQMLVSQYHSIKMFRDVWAYMPGIFLTSVIRTYDIFNNGSELIINLQNIWQGGMGWVVIDIFSSNILPKMLMSRQGLSQQGVWVSFGLPGSWEIPDFR